MKLRLVYLPPKPAGPYDLLDKHGFIGLVPDDQVRGHLSVETDHLRGRGILWKIDAKTGLVTFDNYQDTAPSRKTCWELMFEAGL